MTFAAVTKIQKSSNIQFNEYLQKYVDIMCLYIITNVALYYIHILFLITEPHRYWGRLTVGYLTIDVILIGFAIAIVFFVNINGIIKLFYYGLLFYVPGC